MQARHKKLNIVFEVDQIAQGLVYPKLPLGRAIPAEYCHECKNTPIIIPRDVCYAPVFIENEIELIRKATNNV